MGDNFNRDCQDECLLYHVDNSKAFPFIKFKIGLTRRSRGLQYIEKVKILHRTA